jgi:acyl carrier protein phosphodiesterase
VGNLLGDFARGVEVQALPEAVQAGLQNHRAIDRYTDSHPIILELKNSFSPRRRRFAGIALDVYFDHLLMNHWSVFDSRPIDEVIQVFYARMLEGQALMPNARMRNTTRRMVEYDWFGSYSEIDSIADALDRIASRIRFENQFANAIEDIEHNRESLQRGFLAYFPQLVEHVRYLAIE